MCQNTTQKPTLAIDSSSSSTSRSPCGNPDDCTWCSYTNSKRIRSCSTVSNSSDISSTSGSDGALSSPTESIDDASGLRRADSDYSDQSSQSSRSSGSSRASYSDRSERQARPSRAGRSRTRSGTRSSHTECTEPTGCAEGTEHSAKICVTNLANLSINPSHESNMFGVSDGTSSHSRASRVGSLSSRVLPAMEPMERANTSANKPINCFINAPINTMPDGLDKVVEPPEPVQPAEHVATIGSAANRRRVGDLSSETASTAESHDAEQSIELVIAPSRLQPARPVSIHRLLQVFGLACIIYSFHVVLTRSRSVLLGLASVIPHLNYDYLKLLVYFNIFRCIQYARYIRYIVPSFGLVIILTTALVSIAVLRSLVRALNTCPIIRFLVLSHLTLRLFDFRFTLLAWATLGLSGLAIRSAIVEAASFISALSQSCSPLISLIASSPVISFNPLKSLGLSTLSNPLDGLNAPKTLKTLSTFESPHTFSLFGYLHESKPSTRDFKERKGRLRLQTSPTSPTSTSLYSTDTNEASEPSTPSTPRSLDYPYFPRSGEVRKTLKGRENWASRQWLERLGSTWRSLLASCLASIRAFGITILWAVKILRVVLLLGTCIVSVSATCSLYALWDHSEPFALVFIVVWCFICSRCLIYTTSSSGRKPREMELTIRRVKPRTLSRDLARNSSLTTPPPTITTFIHSILTLANQLIVGALAFCRQMLAYSLGSVAAGAWLLLLGDLEAHTVVFRTLEVIHRFR